MKTGLRRLVAGIVAAAFALLVTFVWLLHDGGRTGPEAPAGAQSGEFATHNPMVDTTDGESEALTGDQAHRDSGVPQAVDAEPLTPDGYSVVRHRGQMTAGGRIAPNDDERGPGPDWLRAADGPQRLASMAAAAGRPWTFGYVELATAAGRTSLERSLAAAGARVVPTRGWTIRKRSRRTTAADRGRSR